MGTTVRNSLGSWIYAGLLFAGASAVVGCNVYDPALLSGGGTPMCSVGDIGCVPSAPTPDPACVANPPSCCTGGDCNQTLVFALRDIILKQSLAGVPLSDPSQPWRTAGLNLDGLVTTATDPRLACKVPNGDPAPIDGVNGIDNVFGSKLTDPVYGLVAAADPLLEEDICCYQGQGVGTIVIRIEGWNGTANDDQVTIALLNAADATRDNPSSIEWSATEFGLVQSMNTSILANPPSWMANTDTYYITPDSYVLNNPAMPRNVDPDGYIRDGMFVMALKPTEAVRLYLGYEHMIGIRLADGTLWGRMSADFNQIDSGGMGGRMGAAQLQEATVGLLGPGVVQPGMCGSSGLLAQVNDVIFKYADVREDGTNDESRSCDALSVGVNFHGIRAAGIQLAASRLCYPYPDCDMTMPPACEPIPGVDLYAPMMPGSCTYNGSPACTYPVPFVPSTGAVDAGP